MNYWKMLEMLSGLESQLSDATASEAEQNAIAAAFDLIRDKYEKLNEEAA